MVEDEGTNYIYMNSAITLSQKGNKLVRFHDLRVVLSDGGAIWQFIHWKGMNCQIFRT